MSTKINTIDWSSKDDYEQNGAYFIIQTFGRNEDNESIHLQINGFEPYFYIRNINNLSKDEFIETLKRLGSIENSFFEEIVKKSIDIAKEKNYKFLRNGQSFEGKVLEYHNFYSIEVLWNKFEVENKKIFYYYQENEEEFFKLKFRSKRAFTLMKKVITEYTEYELFETNIDPLIRFFHDKSLDPSGWIEIKNESSLEYIKYIDKKQKFIPKSRCIHSKKTNIIDVSRFEKNDIAKFLVASFDIECTSETGEFPNANKPNDKIIQIGTTFHYHGDKEPKIHTMVTLNPCDDIDGLDDERLKVVSDEIELLEEWIKIIINYDPDIITGYNIWGFDFKYMYDRYKYLISKELKDSTATNKEFEEELEKNINNFWRFSRLENDNCRFQLKDLSSSALGDNKLYYFETKGRVQIDLLKLAQKDYNLDSYKLDNVSSTFLQGTVENLTGNTFTSNSVDGLFVDNQISFIDIDGDKIENGKKYTIKDITENNITIDENIEDIYKKAKIDKLKEKRNEMPDKENFDESKIKYKLTWCENKIDLPPNKIFENFHISQKMTYNETLKKEYKQLNDSEAGRKMREIAVYCIKDCVLCNTLMIKLDVITKNIGMSNVCCVPLSYLFLRGQGVKIFSVISKYTKLDNYIIPVITKDDINNVSYEGAIVFPPKEGGLLSRNPVAVMDYSSLYPSCMISDNISHDSLIAVYDTDLDGNNPKELKDKLYNKYNKNSNKYPYEKLQESITTGEINKIEYDNIKNGEKIGKRECYYEWNNGNKKGVLPKVLDELLQARKRTRKVQKQYESSNFMWGVLEGLQLAYKVTCNSVYGQMGASTSALCIKELAASTTAKGRNLLTIAKDLVINRELYPKDYLLELNKKIIEDNPKEDASEFINNNNEFKCVYGDTDSVFIDFDTDNLEEAIRLGLQGGRLVTEELIQQNRGNHELEYEKTFYPLVLFTKKRYIGMKYEFNPNKGKLTSMGVVLKRRDNAKILKDIYQGVIDCIMDNKEKDYVKKYYLHNIKRLFAGNMNMNKLIITKTLKGSYKNPNQIAHKVLADRMDRRNPGEGPKSNDRVPYVYIDTNTVECYKCKNRLCEKYKCLDCQQLYCEKCINKYPTKDAKNQKQTSTNKFDFITGKQISNEEIKKKYECHECVKICRECKVELKKKDNSEEIDKSKCYKCKKKIKDKDFKQKEEYNCNICDENFCEKCLKYHSDEYEHKCKTCNGTFCHKCLRKHKNKYPENNCKNIIEKIRNENNKLDSSKSYKCEKLLQGDKIDHPDYIHDNDYIKPDFNYYYEHQIETPVGQIFDLLLEQKERENYDKEINNLIKNI